MSDAAITIYHNPRCSKSRQTLQLIRDAGVEPEIVEYLKTPPSADEIARLLEKLGLEPNKLMRRKEAVFGELGLASRRLTRNESLDLKQATL